MKLYGDYHTHTIYSHGSGTIKDSVEVAEKKGLKELAITDHGFKQKLFNVLRKDIPKIKREIEYLKDKYNVKVYFGLETNLTSKDGHIDIEPEDEEMLDIILMGFHKIVYAHTLKDRFCFFLPNTLSKIFGYSKKRIQINTNAFVQALEKNNIDVITHLGYGIKVDYVQVAKACVKTNTYLELNGKRIVFKDSEMKAIIDTGVKFIINSDAHDAYRVGECVLGFKFALKHNIPFDQIANLNKLPTLKNHKFNR